MVSDMFNKLKQGLEEAIEYHQEKSRKIDITLPIKTVSEANSHEHWSIRRKRHKVQQLYIACEFRTKKLPLPCKISLIRLSKGRMDFDNLVGSFKWIRDTLAEILVPNLAKGRADDDPRIEWIYKQEKSKSIGVRIVIEAIGCQNATHAE